MNENLVSLYPSQQVNIVKVLNFNNLLGLLLYSFFSTWNWLVGIILNLTIIDLQYYINYKYITMI